LEFGQGQIEPLPTRFEKPEPVHRFTGKIFLVNRAIALAGRDRKKWVFFYLFNPVVLSNSGNVESILLSDGNIAPGLFFRPTDK
jgi:hypothetical protein